MFFITFYREMSKNILEISSSIVFMFYRYVTTIHAHLQPEFQQKSAQTATIMGYFSFCSRYLADQYSTIWCRDASVHKYKANRSITVYLKIFFDRFHENYLFLSIMLMKNISRLKFICIFSLISFCSFEIDHSKPLTSFTGV